ncbi:MAG TPA: hypothetical protein VFA90_05285 [Terriglobales bacterium]|nr:hypothetical protein [Terriglobales bacterium]
MRKICVCKVCAISFITLFTTFAAAQLPSGGNGFFGYSYLHGETFANGSSAAAGGPASMSGWETSVEGKYLPWLGAVAELGWNYGGHDTRVCVLFTNCTTFRLNASRDTLLFGPRASITMGRYRPFAEVLLGVGYQSDKGGGISNSDLSFAVGFGGGVDYHLVRSVSLRGQVEAIHTSFFGHSQLDPRISTGIVFSF